MERINKGGRGKKAPYQTSVVRIPTPILADVNALIVKFTTGDNAFSQSVAKNEAIEQAKAILDQKISARKSLTKLLQVLYSDNSISL